MSTPTIRAVFESPPWLNDRAITIAEAARLLDTNHETVRCWIRISRALGSIVPKKQGAARMLSPHQVYILAVLVALNGAGVPINESIIRRAVVVTHNGDGQPVLPGILDIAEFAELGVDGKPVARIECDLGTIWVSVEAKLNALMASAQ